MKRFGSDFWLLSFIGFLAFVSYDLIRSPLLPLFAESLGAAPHLIGLIVGISTITGIFFKLPAGMLSDVVGRKPLLMAGLLVFSLAPPLYFLVETSASLFGLRAFHGFATAIFAPVALALVADRFRERRAEALGWYTAFGQAGRLLGRTLGGLIIAAYGFNTVFGTCSAIGLILIALFFLLHVDPPESIPGGSGPGRSPVRGHILEGLREIKGNGKVLAASGMEAVLLTASGALMAFLPLYGTRVGLNPGEIGLLFGGMGIASIGARPIMGLVSDRLGRFPLIVTGQLFCGCVVGAFPFANTFTGLLFLSVLFGLGEALISSSTSALVADLCRKESLGSAMGVFGTVMDVGHASGPILAGLVIGIGGFGAAFGGAAVLLFVMTGVFGWTFRKGGDTIGNDRK